MAITVAIIGAGSIGFARGMFRDILSVPELRDTHFALTDISRRNLEMVAQLCRKDLRANRLPATVSATTDRRKALSGADYVVNTVRGDVRLLKQAMMMDPLVGAVCDPNEISQMTDEMLIAQARWLPQYRREIPAAKKRFRSEKKLGTCKGKGAVRKRVRTVAELAKDKATIRARTAATDKAAADRAQRLEKAGKK